MLNGDDVCSYRNVKMASLLMQPGSKTIKMLGVIAPQIHICGMISPNKLP